MTTQINEQPAPLISRVLLHTITPLLFKVIINFSLKGALSKCFVVTSLTNMLGVKLSVLLFARGVQVAMAF